MGQTLRGKGYGALHAHQPSLPALEGEQQAHISSAFFVLSVPFHLPNLGPIRCISASNYMKPGSDRAVLEARTTTEENIA